MANTTDHKLVERAVAGDMEAFRELMDKYKRKIYTIAFGIFRNHDDAVAVAKDVYTEVFNSLPKYHGRHDAYSWIYRITVRLCIDRRKNR